MIPQGNYAHRPIKGETARSTNRRDTGNFTLCEILENGTVGEVDQLPRRISRDRETAGSKLLRGGERTTENRRVNRSPSPPGRAEEEEGKVSLEK